MSSELQFRVPRLLESNPHLTRRELSRSLSVSLGGVNYSLNVLVVKGSVNIHNFKNNKNKWVHAYLLALQGVAEKTALIGGFLMRKIQEYHAVKEEIEALVQEALWAETSANGLFDF